MNKKELNNRIYMYKTLLDYKNKMIWLMNTDYTKQRKMIIMHDMHQRTLNKLEKMFPKQNIKDIKSPIDGD